MELRESSGRPFSDWLKKGLLSGKISGVVMGVTDLIFYLAFAVCYSWSFIRQTTLFTRIMTHDQRHFVDGIYNNMALVAILCGIVALLLQNSVRLAVFEGVLAAAGYACWKEGSGKAYLFVMCALIVGATGRSFRVILSETVFLGTVLMLCAVSASQMGIIEDLVYNGTRHSFGIVYCTDCAAHILFLMLAWLMLRIESIRAADYLPHNYDPNCVVYTGTHDNETLYSWYQLITEEERRMVREYLNHAGSTVEEICRDLICLVMRSVARICVIPLQDYLALDNSARINHPSTQGTNWKWRLAAGQFDEKLQNDMADLAGRYGRLNLEAVTKMKIEEEEQQENAHAVDCREEAIFRKPEDD